MGNGQGQPQNQRFNPNFNMAQYNQRMNQMRSQYNHQSNLDAPGAYYGPRAAEKSMNCQQITRNVYIFKTTIQIHVDGNGKVNVGFQYHSSNVARFDIGLGVRNIGQDQHTKQTTNVDCIQAFDQPLQAGDKVKFSRIYQIDRNMSKDLLRYGILMKISSNNEYSEYSLSYNSSTKLWKVLVQNYWRQNKIYGIQDIYGGGDEGQQCIVCFTQKSTTMVKPCNHLCLCGQCAKVLQRQSNSCPICRKKIASLITLTTNKN